jgi:hypothetical protein
MDSLVERADRINRVAKIAKIAGIVKIENPQKRSSSRRYQFTRRKPPI